MSLSNKHIPYLIVAAIVIVVIYIIRKYMTKGDENTYVPPPARGYLGPGTLPATPTPTPAPTPSPSPVPYHPHHHIHPHHYYPALYNYYWNYPTDALVLQSLNNEVRERSRCYKEVSVNTKDYGIRRLCLNKTEYRQHLRKQLNNFRSNLRDAANRKDSSSKIRELKSQVQRLEREIDVELSKP